MELFKTTKQKVLVNILSFSILVVPLTACGEGKNPNTDNYQSGISSSNTLVLDRTPSPLVPRTETPTITSVPPVEIKTDGALPTIEAIIPTIEAVVATVVATAEKQNNPNQSAANNNIANTPSTLVPDLQKIPNELKPMPQLVEIDDTKFTGCKTIINVENITWTDNDPIYKAHVTFTCETQDGGRATVEVWVPKDMKNPAVGFEVVREERNNEGKHKIFFKNGVEAIVRTFR